MKKAIEWIFLNRLEEVGKLEKLLDFLHEEFSISEDSLFRINLVLDELITNTIKYAYKDHGEHQIKLIIHPDGPEYLHIELIDHGVAFNPLEWHEPIFSNNIEDRPIGGLGIHFAKEFTEKIAYHRKNDQNYLKLIFKIN